jgi:hypothetical protein
MTPQERFLAFLDKQHMTLLPHQLRAMQSALTPEMMRLTGCGVGRTTALRLLDEFLAELPPDDTPNLHLSEEQKKELLG